MSATSRGAYVGWMSQYPDEVEFIYSPLCCLEVMKGTGPKEVGGVIRYEMAFTQNSQICEPASTPAANVPRMASKELVKPDARAIIGSQQVAHAISGLHVSAGERGELPRAGHSLDSAYERERHR